MTERLCRITTYAEKRQFLLDLIETIIFDDDVVTAYKLTGPKYAAAAISNNTTPAPTTAMS